MSNVKISRKKLGEGAFSKVFKGTMLRNKSQIDIAVKKIPNDGEYYEENAQKENEVLRSMGMHENIIETIGQICELQSQLSDVSVVVQEVVMKPFTGYRGTTGNSVKLFRNNLNQLSKKMRPIREKMPE